jgi:hypothetical protein
MTPLDRLRQRLAASLPTVFRIAYWVPHNDDRLEDASPFLAFLPGILSTSSLFEVAVRRPFDIRELFSSRESVAICRDLGIVDPHIYPVNLTAFAEVVAGTPYHFNCVLTNESTRSAVSQLLVPAARARTGWLHLSDVEGSGVDGTLRSSTDEVFNSFFRTSIGLFDSSLSTRAIYQEFVEEPLRSWAPVTLPCARYGHNVTRPNELAIEGLGGRFGESAEGRPIPSGGHASGALRSVRALAAFKERLLAPNGSRHGRRLTVAVDSVTWGIARAGWRRRLRESGLSGAAIRLISQAIHRSGYTVELDLPPNRLRELLSDQAVATVLGLRSAEMRAFTAALAVHSSAAAIPVLRLSPGLNSLRPKMVDISACARGVGPHREFKISKLVRRTSDQMRQIIGPALLGEIRGAANATQSITLVSDLPLEWLQIDGMPLALRHHVSRVPVSPGNLSFGVCVDSHPIYVPASTLNEILVIRSFREGDRIAGHLEKALRFPMPGDSSSGPTVTFVDVASADEFVDALSRYEGAILVFDGHGTRDEATGVGSVVVGGRPLDVWSLRDRVRMPPIVLLSACDTLPIDGSHGSSAVGMLALGAKAVLATLLPVESIRSAVFMHRLLWRLTGLLPLLLQRADDGVEWRIFMSGMLKMVYATELTELVMKRFGPLPNHYEIGTRANMDINVGDPRWLKKHQRHLATATRQATAEIERFTIEYASMTDSLRYVQLGRPDLVRIVAASHSDVAGSLA